MKLLIKHYSRNKINLERTSISSAVPVIFCSSFRVFHGIKALELLSSYHAKLILVVELFIGSDERAVW